MFTLRSWLTQRQSTSPPRRTHRLMWLATSLMLAGLSGCGGGSGTEATSAHPTRQAQAESSTVLRWSDPASGLPRSEQDLNGATEIVIPAGTTVVLDMNPPALPALRIEGALEFEDSQDLNLRAQSIQLSGRLQVGSSAAPFSHRATLTLTGARTNTDSGVLNDGVARGLQVNNGALLLYGAFQGPAWAQLDRHLPAGSTQVTLDQRVQWRAGDTLVVAPTDFYALAQTERTTLAADSKNSRLLTLSSGLQTARWGLLQYPTAQGMRLKPDPTYTPPATPAPTVLDERAEVGNLSRRIVIEGADDTEWQEHSFGGHIMIMGLKSQVVIDGVELRRMGQAGKLARYPVHWHILSYNIATGAELGDATGHVIRNSAIWNSAQRCIVIHATNGVTVENNICHDIKGHAIFLEDAVERRNTIQGNLILKVRSPDADKLLKVHEGPQVYQAGPSGVWMTNPDNTLRNNHAADAHGNGFWLSFPLRSLGLSRQVALHPKFMRLGTVEDNTAHSNGGPGQLMEWVPLDDAVDHPEQTLGSLMPQAYNPMSDDQPCYDGGGNFWDWCTRRQTFEVKRITLYKNGANGNQGAYRNRAVQPTYLEWVSADNAGTHFAGATFDGSLSRALLVGRSLNKGAGDPPYLSPSVGFATYHSALSMSWNTLINFPMVSGTPSGAFMTDDYYLRPLDKGTLRNEGNRLIATHPGYRTLPPNLLTTTYNRADNWTLAGALWDPYGYWGPAGRYLMFNDPFLTTGQDCVPMDGAKAGDGKNGRSCVGPFYGVSGLQTDVDTDRFLFSADIRVKRQDPATGATVGTWRVHDGYGSWTDKAGVVHGCDTNNPPPVGKTCSFRLGWMRHFVAVPNGRYELDFPTHARSPRFVSLDIDNAYRTTDSLLLGMQFDGRVTAAGYVIAGRKYNREYPLLNPSGNPASTTAALTETRYYQPVASLAEVLADTTGRKMWQDRSNNRVWVRVKGYRYSALQQGQLEGTSEDALYYAQSIVLHPSGLCGTLSYGQFDACLSMIQALQP